MARVRVNVTREHIEAGETGSPCACPIARAVKAVVKRNVHVDVDVVDVALIEGGDIEARPLSKRASEFVVAFDSGYDVKPFAFTLNIPKRYLRKAK